MNTLVQKMKEVTISVLPITLIVVLLHFTLAPLAPMVFGRFLLGAAFIILGLSIFLLGVDLGVSPIGNLMGTGLTKSNKLWVVIAGGLGLGFFISIAEPDLHILAGQVADVTSGLVSKWTLVLVVSVGIAVMLSLGLIRIVRNIPLYKLLTVLYGIIFLLAIFTSREFLAISFDASGATTGAMTVPFIIAVSIGVSALKSDSNASEKDSFGLVAIASTGAILSVLLMSIVAGVDEISGVLEMENGLGGAFFHPFLEEFPQVAMDSFFALFPILAIFLIFQIISFKISRKALRKILFGMLYALIGLILFLVGVNAGFMDVGSQVGYLIASTGNYGVLILIGFVLGLVTILAEPAVYVLTHQIENVTSGYVPRKVVLLALSIGVGFSVGLSILRVVVPGIQLWHYLLPGYAIAVLMMYFVPKLFVGIAFDSGGVASGPMTATFVLAFAQGAAHAIDGADVLIDGFGVIAMVALTPLIALQIVGFIFKIKSRKEGMDTNGDEPGYQGV